MKRGFIKMKGYEAGFAALFGEKSTHNAILAV